MVNNMPRQEEMPRDSGLAASLGPTGQPSQE